MTEEEKKTKHRVGIGPGRKPKAITTARREKIRELFLKKTPQREIAQALKCSIQTVNEDIKFICEEFLKEARKRSTFGQIAMELWRNRNEIISKAWNLYDQALGDGQLSAAAQALGKIQQADSNLVDNFTRLGIIEEAPLKVEVSTAELVARELLTPAKKVMK